MEAKKKSVMTGSAVAAGALFLTTIVSGCGGSSGGNTSNSGASSDSNSGEPVTITMSLNFDGKEVPKPGNEVEKAIEKYTNTKLKIQELPSTTYNQKLPVMVASGDLPDVIAADPHAQGSSWLLNAIQQGQFWDLTPYIKQYPKLFNINPIILKNAEVNGHLYGLPRVRPLARNVTFVRADWLKNLGLQVPKTLDQYLDMLRKFTHDDPGKDGKNDTFGLSVTTAFSTTVDSFAVAFGAPNNWKVVNGKFIKDVDTPQYLKGLEFEKKLYDEHLVNSDSAVIQRPQWEGYFFDGKAGAIGNTSNTGDAYLASLKQNNPKAEITAFSALAAPDGQIRVPAGPGYNGELMFPKSAVKTEAQLKQILNFFEKLDDRPMANLLAYGIKGKDYTVKNGKAVINPNSDYNDTVAYPYRFPLGVVDPTTYAIPAANLSAIDQLTNKLVEENDKYVVTDPTYTLTSPTYQQRGAQLDKILTDANTQFLLGKITVQQWKAQVKKWHEEGGDQIAKEYAEAYAKQQK
ncbi:extracellular solute-binding protein [Alicyclobacillus shizuokensis]|uniref:extracellular solute-binding protein n=1 Tax=Alicyclobacillus shizuokensis TaxID=392014 RepID=UPI00082F84FE|nr:extracellular solute-binding protein [Alicyclobacillus shizuokensis]MCL6624967.1 extracellular solute-binding protein [Alicyclobacillus shizuokensis]